MTPVIGTVVPEVTVVSGAGTALGLGVTPGTGRSTAGGREATPGADQVRSQSGE